MKSLLSGEPVCYPSCYNAEWQYTNFTKKKETEAAKAAAAVVEAAEQKACQRHLQSLRCQRRERLAREFQNTEQQAIGAAKTRVQE